MSKRRLNLGRLGEQRAVDYLQQKGYQILARNFRTRFGEIDIIAVDDQFLVLIEVKTRRTQNYGLPEEAVTPKKIQTMIKVGQYYRKHHPQAPDLIRLDVIAIELDSSGQTTDFRHLKAVL